MNSPSVYQFRAPRDESIIVSIVHALQKVVDHENVGPLEDDISCDGLERLFSESPIQDDLQVRFVAEDCLITVLGDRTIKIQK